MVCKAGPDRQRARLARTRCSTSCLHTCPVCVLQVPGYTYADAWQDPAVWPTGAVPLEGQDVTVPEGVVLVINETQPALGLLHVAGGLIIDPDQVSRRLGCHTLLPCAGRQRRSAAAVRQTRTSCSQ